MQRMAHVVEIRPEWIEEYERIHVDVWTEVVAALTAANITNYSIFRYDNLLFSYWEYLGDDYEDDLATIAADPVSKKWNDLTDNMLRPAPGAAPDQFALPIPCVFHLD